MKKIYMVVSLLMMLICKIGFAQYAGVGTFTRINSMAELTDGYYVVAFGSTQAMNNTNSSGFFGNTAITPAGAVITNPATNIVWEIETNGSGRSIYNEASATFVSYTGISNAAQAVAAVATDNQRWTFSYTGALFVITNLAINTRDLQYNSGAPRFACYTGTQNDITLYKFTVTAANRYWDVLAGASNGTGGNGTWGTTFSTTTVGDATLTTAATIDNVFFQGTAGTVTLGANQTAASNTFNVTDYSISTSGTPRTLTGNIALTGAINLNTSPATGTTLNLPGVISATTTGRITQNGLGTTVLTGTNTYAGSTTITLGTLSVGALGNLGSGTSVILNGGTLAVTGNIALNKNITLPATSTLNTGAGFTLTYSGAPISGVGGLTKTGAGTFILPNGNTYTGKTNVNAGIFSTSGESAFGASPAAFVADQITFNGGTLLSSGNLSFNSNRGITLAVGGGTFNAAGANIITAVNIITGPGGLNKTGPGTLRFDVNGGTHTYSGSTTISQGILQLERDNDIPDASNIILAGGTLNTARSSDLSGRAEDAGTLALTASSTINLGTADHTLSFTNPSGTYTGILTITGWTGTSGNSGTAGKIRIGTTATSLGAAQKAQIQFSGYAQGGVIQLSDGELVPAGTVSLDHVGMAQTTASNILTGSTNNILSNFRANVTGVAIILNSISFNIGGTFVAGDLDNINLYTSTSSTFPGGAPLSTVNATTIGTGGTVSFTGLTQACALGARYFWITADVDAAGTSGNTVIVPATPTVIFAAAAVTNNITIGGTKTIVSNTITTGAATFGPFCNDIANNITLPFSQAGIFTGQFNIQYSSATGVFPTDATSQLLTYVSNTATSVTATIPAGLLAAGTGYHFRVVNATPVYYTSGSNGNNVTINAVPAVAAIGGGASTVCIAAATPAFTNATGGGTWSITPGTGTASITVGGIVTGSTAGTVTVVYTVLSGACSNSVSTSLTVNPLPANPAGTISISANPSCGPATLSYPAAVAPLVNYWQTTPGVVTTNPTSVNYVLNASGTIYVRTQNTTTGCWSTGTINTGSIAINNPVVITTQPPNRNVTSPTGTTFFVTATGTGLTYQWQIDIGSGWTNLT
ncbi:MAG: autotransporter-associated beta strand repeat-containing protein, partial [Rhizobacter sp.]|nr:autotransporter-associated beta strand repeat-containing protein [Ferruginibacter sp.]